MTLIELLERRSRDQARRTAFLFEAEECDYGELWRRLNCFAASLLQRGLEPGERVVLALPNGADFFTAFYGVQRAGGIPVPLNPESGPGRVADIAAHAGAGLVIVAADATTDLRTTLGSRVTLLPVSGDCEGPKSIKYPALAADDICFIQYTSGSTGDPKGVLLSHRNLLANLDQLIAGMRITRDDVFVSWLPLSHDMGLILMSMVPFYLAARLVLLPARLTSVQPWLTAIQLHRGTLTAAPDFAYRFCTRYLKKPERFDLGSLRIALDAAEPVHLTTVQAFEHKFGLHNVMLPGYGLAEASVGVSTWIPGLPVRTDVHGNVSVGPPFPGMEVRIGRVDTPLRPGKVGEILLRGPSVTGGYHRNPAATAQLQAGEGFIRTGDLGYLDRDGYLYIVSRLKDIIIHAGRNIAPREAEESLDELGFVRQCAALGIDRGGVQGEQIYLFAEVRPGRCQLAEQSGEIVRAFQSRFGFRPGRVHLLTPHSIPRTANGKLQRGILKERYLAGSLKGEGLILYPDY